MLEQSVSRKDSKPAKPNRGSPPVLLNLSFRGFRDSKFSGLESLNNIVIQFS